MIDETPEQIAAREAQAAAARAADPMWRAEQARKNQAASDRFAAWRAHNDIPLIRKAPGERM